MKTDRTTKLLLALIAFALLLNALNPWLQPMTTSAQDNTYLVRMASSLSSIESDVSAIEDDVDDIEDGTCLNSTICD